MSVFSGVEEFIAVVESGSYSAAAKKLGCTKSTISKKISQLENTIGMPLFYRSARRADLTKIGKEFFTHCHSLKNAHLDKLNTVLADKDEVCGDIYVSLPPSVGERFIMPLIVEFQQKYPECKIIANFSTEVINMFDTEADVSFRLAPDIDPNLIAKPLLSANYVLVCSPELAAQISIHSIDEISSVPTLSYGHTTRSSPITWTIRINNKIHNVAVDPVLTSDSVSALVDACCRGMGVLYCSKFFVSQQLSQHKLVSLFSESIQSSTKLWMVFPDRKSISSRLRLFIDFISEHI